MVVPESRLFIDQNGFASESFGLSPFPRTLLRPVSHGSGIIGLGLANVSKHVCQSTGETIIMVLTFLDHVVFLLSFTHSFTSISSLLQKSEDELKRLRLTKTWVLRTGRTLSNFSAGQTYVEETS